MCWLTSSAAFVAAGLMLASCGSEPSAANAAAPVASPDAVTKPSTAPATTPTAAVGEPASVTLAGVADDALPGTEAPEGDVLGTWEVVDVAPDAGTAANASPDRGMVGRRMSYTSDLLGWIGPDGKVAASGSCPNPGYAILQTAAVARDMGKAFRPAWGRFGLTSAEVGAPHSWDCDTADEVYFGPHGGAVFYPVTGHRMVMEWDDGRILLLRRIPA